MDISSSILVVHLVHTLFGGVSTVVANLVKEQIKIGIIPIVAYSVYDEAFDKSVGFEIKKYYIETKKLPGYSILFGMNPSKIIKKIKKEFPGYKIIIHAHNVQTIGLLSNIKNIHILCTLHGTHGQEISFRTKLSDYIVRRILIKLKKYDNIIVAVSDQVRRFWDQNNNIGIMRIFNGTILHETFHQKQAIITIGHVGDISYAKGVDKLLNGFVNVHDVNPNIKLVLAGKEKSFSIAELDEFTKEKNISESVKYLGFVPNASMTVFPIIDIFVLLSRNEGLPLSVIEAMSRGIPCICSTIGGIPEIIIDGINGFLVSTYDEMAERVLLLSSSDELYEQISKNARETVKQKFSVEAMFAQYNDAYQHLVNKE